MNHGNTLETSGEDAVTTALKGIFTETGTSDSRSRVWGFTGNK
jgi:hypothetical protein